MSSSLKRVLRIRTLQEELARMELEVEAARLRGLERQAEEADGEALACRRRWFAGVQGEAEGPARQGPARPGPAEALTPAPGPRAAAAPGEEHSAWELAIWRRERAVARQPAQQAQVGRAREQFLEGRRERLQIESLVEAASARERREAERREQTKLDDWYRSQPGTKEGPGTGDPKEGNAKGAGLHGTDGPGRAEGRG